MKRPKTKPSRLGRILADLEDLILIEEAVQEEWPDSVRQSELGTELIQNLEQLQDLHTTIFELEMLPLPSSTVKPDAD